MLSGFLSVGSTLEINFKYVRAVVLQMQLRITFLRTYSTWRWRQFAFAFVTIDDLDS